MTLASKRIFLSHTLAIMHILRHLRPCTKACDPGRVVTPHSIPWSESFAPSNSDMAAALVAYPINLSKQTLPQSRSLRVSFPFLLPPLPSPPLFNPLLLHLFPPPPFKHFPSSQSLHSLALKLTIPLTLSKEKYATPLKWDGRLNGADKITSSSLMI